MKTAIVTGASSGLGREFVRCLKEFFPEVECCWLITRREDRLEELAESMEGMFRFRLLPLDLCEEESFTAYQDALVEERPDVSVLINNAGVGYLCRLGNAATALQTRMVDLNVRAPTALTNLTLPYMKAGGRIVNVSSVAAFCPTPRMTVYSSTKAYVSAFTIGLAEEVREKGITATAVCPGPMETEFLWVGHITGNSPLFAALPSCDQVRVARGALRAAREGRMVYTPRLVYKSYRLLAKLMPVEWLVKLVRV